MARARFLVMLIAIAIAATGCASAAENIVENVIENAIENEGGSGDVNLDIDEDDGSFSIETDEGSIEMGGTDIPDDFPLPIPDYEEVSTVITSNQGGTESTQIILSFDPEDINQVADLYKDFFDDQGWEVSRLDSSADDVTSIWISGTSDDVNAAAVIGYSDDDDVASLSLSYSSG